MAKEVTLTVKVDDEQFKEFQKNFGEFSDKIKDLMNKFKQVQGPVDQATQSARALTTNMQNLLETTKNVHGTVDKITKHFGKWASLISGTMMMLGAGAGLYGIDRMSKSMMQQRRMMLGLGGDTAATQATLRAGQMMQDSPLGTMQAIKMGMAGDQDKQTALRSMGVFDPNKSPEEIMRALKDKLPDFFAGMRPGTELLKSRAFGLEKLMPEEDQLRYMGPKGREARAAEAEEEKRKPAPISDEALKKWTQLNQAYENFTTNLKNRIAEGLSGVAEKLTELSKGLTKTIDTLMKWPIIIQITKAMEDWAKQFGDWLEKDDTQKAIAQFAKDINDNVIKPMNEFGDLLNLINKSLTDFAHWIRRLLGLDSDKPSAMGNLGSKSWAPPGGEKSPTAPPSYSPPPPATTLPGIFKNFFTPWKASALGGSSTSSSLFSAGPSNASATTRLASSFSNMNRYGGLNFSGGGGTRLTAMGSGGRGSTRLVSLGGGGGVGGTRLVGAPGGGGGGGGGLTHFASAAQRFQPRENAGGLAFASNTFMQSNRFGGGRRGDMGPLHSDNWQNSRTATLRIDNVPGSSIHAAATAMA